MPTEVKSLIKDVRDFLMETKPRFWSDDELTGYMSDGVQDLWGAILDVHGDHYMVVDTTHVQLKTDAEQLSGVPENCFRILQIEPRNTTSDGSARQLQFIPRKYNHPDFVAARTRSATDPGMVSQVFYAVSGVGPPVEAPTILTSPKLSSDLDVRLVYCPSITLGAFNPVPGSSDNALKSWVKAYALAKEGPQGQRVPDAGWLSIYGTEKQLIITRITPRQEQEPEVVDDLFEGLGHL